MNILKISNSSDNSVRYVINHDAVRISCNQEIMTGNYNIYVHILSGNETTVMSKPYKVKEEAESALNKLKTDYEIFCLSGDENKIFNMTL